MHPFLHKLGIDLPIIQGPDGGCVDAGNGRCRLECWRLGSIGVGPVDFEITRQMIAAVRARTNRPFNINVFCNQPAVVDAAREAAWLARLSPMFVAYGSKPPAHLTEIYQTFLTDDAKLAVLLAERPAVVSFHFGLPAPDKIQALRAAGIVLLATATNLAEGMAIAAAGIDAVVAQGYEAGGHRGVFDPKGPDDRLGTLALTRLLVKKLAIPVIAAGGIMDGAGIAAVLVLGAAAAQMGTAFIACPESSADAAYRSALLGPAAEHTAVTSAISGRPARCLVNRFTALGASVKPEAIPDYPIAYDAAKALHAVAKAAGEFGYGAQWAGQGAPLTRAQPAAQLIARLQDEMKKSLAPT